MVYRKWLGVNIPLFCFCIIFINMILIIHYVLIQKRKSNRYRLRPDDSENECGSRMPICVLCVIYCFVKFYATFNEFVCCGKSSTEHESTHNNDIQAAAGNGDNIIHREPLPSKATKNAPSGNADTLPTLQACLAPVEMLLATPTFQQVTHSGNAGKSVCWGDEENGLSRHSLKPRASASRSGTAADPYKFNTAKVRAAIRRESIIAVSPLLHYRPTKERNYAREQPNPELPRQMKRMQTPMMKMRMEITATTAIVALK